MKNSSLFQFFAIVALLMLLWFTYNDILLLGFTPSSGFSLSALAKLVIIIISIMALLLSGNKVQTKYTLMWILWVLWLLVDFFFFGIKGEGASKIIHVTFCPMTFVLFFTIGKQSEKVKTIAIVGFVLIFIVSTYLIYNNLSHFAGIVVGKEMGYTNLVYWCLCPLPVLLLFEKKWGRILAISVTTLIVILTGKRSATLAITIIILLFFLNVRREKYAFKGYFAIIIAILAMYFIVSKYAEGSFVGILDRMEALEEDQGNGRLDIYEDVLQELGKGDIADWLLGRGFGSIYQTGHTNAHNDALQMLFEYGVVGFMVYVVMLVFIIKRMVLLRKCKSDYYVSYASSVVIALVLGAVSNLFVYYSYFSFLCVYWGIVEADLMQSGQVKKFLIKVF